MVKKIIHFSDVHFRTFKGLEQYSETLSTAITMFSEIVEKYGKDETRIVIAGDLVNDKLNVSNEQINAVSSFLSDLSSLCKVVVLGGNHDFNVNNRDRIDTISTIVDLSKYDNVLYIDKECEFKSSCYTDDNIIWCNYSIFDDYKKPDWEICKNYNENGVCVGLFHGVLVGAKMDSGLKSSSGISPSVFEGLDFVCCGHIHERQELEHDGVKIVYSGSIMQQNKGEKVTGHGFCLWDVEAKTYEAIDIPSKYGIYKISIDSIDDIDDNKEVFLNLK